MGAGIESARRAPGPVRCHQVLSPETAANSERKVKFPPPWTAFTKQPFPSMFYIYHFHGSQRSNDEFREPELVAVVGST
jgi:hypothetical protein